MVYEKLTLQEWIEIGRENGTITDVLTAIWAYCMDESAALEWIAAIVRGQVSERDALRALRQDRASNAVMSEIDWSRANQNAENDTASV
jgi:hypothetical protein